MFNIVQCGKGGKKISCFLCPSKAPPRLFEYFLCVTDAFHSNLDLFVFMDRLIRKLSCFMGKTSICVSVLFSLYSGKSKLINP